MAKDAKLVEQLKSIRKGYFNKANPRFHYDTFFKNSFESKVYTEITEKNLFKGERLGFIYNLRLWLGHISPNSSASENLDTILRYTQNGYTKEQMIYYLFKVADWIDTIQNNRWLSNYEQHFKEVIGDTQIDNLLKLKSLIHLTLHHLTKSPIPISQIEDETYVSPETELRTRHEKQLELIQEITAFLLNEYDEDKSKTIMNEENYEKLINYIKDVQINNKYRDYGIIKLNVSLKESEIYYTMYLVNQILENNFSNNKIVFKRLSSPYRVINIILQFDVFKDLKKQSDIYIDSPLTDLKMKLIGSTLQRKFSTCPKSYRELNKHSRNMVIKKKIT